MSRVSSVPYYRLVSTLVLTFLTFTLTRPVAAQSEVVCKERLLTRPAQSFPMPR